MQELEVSIFLPEIGDESRYFLFLGRFKIYIPVILGALSQVAGIQSTIPESDDSKPKRNFTRNSLKLIFCMMMKNPFSRNAHKANKN